MVYCISNLNNCNAGCCRVLTFDIDKFPGARIGDLIILNRPGISKDLIMYYELHGLFYDSEKIKFRLRNFHYDKKNKKLYVYNTCRALLPTNLCDLHGTEFKPDVCNNLDFKNTNVKDVTITKGCILENETND